MRFARRRRRTPRRQLRARHVVTLVPNILTLAALGAGLTSIRFAIEAQYELAVGFIVAAVVLDGLDGRAARMLHVTSRFGAELDSLSDFICFGAAPALMIYFWSLNEYPSVGWALAFLFATCCALRLARFNTELDNPDPPVWMANFFKGVPAPAGAASVLLPMLLAFATGSTWPQTWGLNALLTLVVALLMVSRVPTWSVKRLRIAPQFVLPALVVGGVLVAILATEPWSALFVLVAAYLLTLPLAASIAYRRRRREEEVEAGEAPLPQAGE